MRWNPRRRQVTSVVYVQSSKPAEAEKPKSPWNSLEKAKLAISALTPVLIAIVGVYVTMHSHADDVQRIAAEQIRARRAAALPIIFDLDQQFTTFSNVASDAIYKAHAAITVLPSKPQLALAQSERVSAAIIDYRRRYQEDWLKLRPLLNNEDQYGALHTLSQSGVFNAVTSAANDCMYAVVDDKGKELPNKCHRLLGNNRSTSCEFLVNYRLERFDQVEPDALVTQSNRTFCPDAMP